MLELKVIFGFFEMLYWYLWRKALRAEIYFMKTILIRYKYCNK